MHIKKIKTSSELISTYQVTVGQISTWKKRLIDGAPQLFDRKQDSVVNEEALTAPLYEEIGRLKVELDWLKKKLTLDVGDKRLLIDSDNDQISIRRQCELLGLSRSTLYYQAKPVTDGFQVKVRHVE